MAKRIVCTNCGEAALAGERDLCHACYQYRWRTGRPRPARENVVLARIAAVKRGHPWPTSP
jgi:NMD protein affecting ribosome stability and mRNA decay